MTATSSLSRGQLLKDPPLIPAGTARSGPAGRLAAAAMRWGPWPTPSVLRAARLLTALLLALAGLLGVSAAAARVAAITEIATRIEPLSADTATVYGALADADAAVISGFVAGAAEPGDLRARVDEDLATAAAGLVRAAGRADDQSTTDAIATLGRQLPEYAGLVELARANQGDPATGQAALHRASDLMQTGMLPVAETLLQRQGYLLDRAYLSASAVPVVLLVVVVVLAAVMIVFQVWMAHRFRRGLNLGMVVATGTVLVGVLLWIMSGIASGSHVGASQAHGQAVSDALVPARIAALQARTAEGLALVEQGDARHERDFDDRIRQLGPDGTDGALGAAARMVSDPAAQARVREAIAAAAAYRDAHDPVQRAVAAGRQAEALRLAFAAEPDSPIGAFTRLDAALAAAVDAERGSFAEQTAQARNWSVGSGVIVGVLALIGIAAVALGIAARLREYP